MDSTLATLELPAVRRTPCRLLPKGQNFFNNATHVQLLQWVYGKQQQQDRVSTLVVIRSEGIFYVAF